MSASGLDLGDDASGSDVLSSVSEYLEGGGSVTNLLTSSILGLIVSPFVAAIDIINAITGFFTTPFEEVAEAVAALSSALFEEPAGLVADGFDISAQALGTFFGESFIGIFAGPIGVGIVLLSFLLVYEYLQEDETGDTLPFVPVDVPFLGVEEEDEES